MSRALLAVVAFAIVSSSGGPAFAQGEVVITQAKANAGNVTPNDAPGFPVTISRAGSYVLGGNLQVPADKVGLQVTSHNVDIDLNGFRIDGGNVATNAIASNYGESSIHDGIIKRFKASGIYLRNGTWTIENMQVFFNGGFGIDAGHNSNYNTFLNNTIVANGFSGLVTGDFARIQNNNISSNDLWGLLCGGYCHVEGNNVSGNKTGISIDSGVALGNTVIGNSGGGIVGGVYNGVVVYLGAGNNSLAKDGAFPMGQYVRSLQPNTCDGSPC